MTDKNVPKLRRDNDDGASYEILIPCAPEEFGKFIGGLLGKPQTIEKRFPGCFIVQREHLLNLHYLVDQRLTQQNGGSLVQLSLTISYDDNSTVELGSLDEFNSYAEVKPRVSQSVSMAWTYLVHFPQRKAPEKQTIEVNFQANYPDAPDSTEWIFENLFADKLAGTATPGFQIRIQHTARSWGVDIESLLTGHIQSLRAPAPPPRRIWLHKNAALLSRFAGSGFLIASMAGMFLALDDITRSATMKFQSFMSSLSPETQSGELTKYIAEELLSSLLPRQFFLMVALAAISAWLATFLTSSLAPLLRLRRRGALLLTQQAKERFEEQKSADDRYFIRLMGKVVSTLLLGVIGNYIFAWLTAGIVAN